MSRIALVSGGGRGIGRAISIALAQAGCDVMVNFSHDQRSAETTVSEIEKLGQRAMAMQARVEDWGDCEQLVATTRDQLGPISVLVHNAGTVGSLCSVADTSPEEVRQVMGVNAMGGFHLAKLTIPMLIEQPRGDIVLISSVATQNLRAHRAPYNMSKAALEALSMTLAKELAHHPVCVNVVAPGLVSTSMGDQMVRDKTGGRVTEARELDHLAPRGRVCSPEDVAAVVRLLVSEDASYLSGSRIRVDGGASTLA